MPITLSDGGIFTVFPNAPPSYDYVADTTDYVGIIAGAVSGQNVGLLPGIYLNGLTVPSGVIVTAVSGLGSVNFTAGTIGNSYSNAVIKLENTGSVIDGIIAHDPNTPYAHALFITGDYNIVRNCAAYNGGYHKHKIPCRLAGSNNLIEDSFFFGEGRYTVMTFSCINNTFRRVLARWDSTVSGELTEPNATFSTYNSYGNLYENCISIDYNSTPELMRFGGDFYAPHNEGIWPAGNNNNSWHGCIVAYHDKTNDGGRNNNRAFRADSNSTNLTNNINNVITNFYIRDSLRDFIIKFNYEIDIDAVTRIGLTSETDDGPIKSNGGNMLAAPGADIDFHYINGIKTTTPMWPFKHEDVAKIEMAKVPNGTRGWVSSGKTLENYIKGI